MVGTRAFLQSLIDSLSDQIAVIDEHGEIVFVNRTWRSFGAKNGFPTKFSWLGENYLNTCLGAGEEGDLIASKVHNSLRNLITGKVEECEVEYPCNAPKKKRWYVMRATIVQRAPRQLFAISHREVTRRKLAEEQAERLAMEDSLSGIANRRRFDQALKEEWRRRKRSKAPISLIMIDIDHFKRYNDTFGHLEGDTCLQQMASAIAPLARRAGDLVARVGGEEFAIILPGMNGDDARAKAEEARHVIESLPISDEGLKASITASFGVATANHECEGAMLDLIRVADEALYLAKRDGRNRVSYQLVA